MLSCEIKAFLKDTYVSLKVDGATWLYRSILGINVQFVSNSQIEIRTLGMVELKKRSIKYIMSVIWDILQNYKIKLWQALHTMGPI